MCETVQWRMVKLFLACIPFLSFESQEIFNMVDTGGISFLKLHICSFMPGSLESSKSGESNRLAVGLPITNVSLD